MDLRVHSAPLQALIYTLLLGLAGLAWLTSMVLPSTPLAGVLSHSHAGGFEAGVPAPGGAVAGLALFLVGWTVMTAAMMLPTSLPMVATFGRLVRHRANAYRRVWLFVVGYLSAWGGFGVLAYSGDLLVHRAVDASPFLASHTGLIGGGVLIAAGVYQLTPLKQRCLQQCRSAFSFLMSYWRDGLGGAWQMGVHHGIFCVGCCWALMLVMFGLGMLQMAWMLSLALLMFVEKVVRGGERIAVYISPVFVVLGLLVCAGVLF
jgi:predicted metal-binding membrane protein